MIRRSLLFVHWCFVVIRWIDEIILSPEIVYATIDYLQIDLSSYHVSINGFCVNISSNKVDLSIIRINKKNSVESLKQFVEYRAAGSTKINMKFMW